MLTPERLVYFGSVIFHIRWTDENDNRGLCSIIGVSDFRCRWSSQRAVVYIEPSCPGKWDCHLRH